jgi:hypothetical protein
MGYASPDDFAVFGLPAAATSSVDASVIQAHCDRWSEKIDQIVSTRGLPPIPGPPYPSIVVAWVCELAGYSLLTTIGFKPTNKNDTAVKDRHDAVLAELKAIEDGRAPPWTGANTATAATSQPLRGWYDDTGNIT